MHESNQTLKNQSFVVTFNNFILLKLLFLIARYIYSTLLRERRLSQWFIEVEILFENGGTKSERTSNQEAHGICIAGDTSETIVVGENDSSTVSAYIGTVASTMRTTHKNYLTTLILVVFIHINFVFSFRIGSSFFGELQHPCGSISALQPHFRPCFIFID